MLNRLESTIRTLESSKPDKLVSDVSIATAHDLEEIWHQNRSTIEPIESFIHHVIEDLAQEQPSSPAVCAWDGTLTYGEFNEFATRLASELARRGVVAGTIVPICFEKSMLTPLVMLAVLKAGGAFLLLDASLPEHRLKQIVQQTKATLILCSHTNKDVISRIASDNMVITKQALIDLGLAKGGSLVHPLTDLNSPAYVIFTSGSTGVPKGVLISHKNVASAFLQEEKLFGCGKDSRVYDFASYNFTVSLTNFFMTFARGGCLCVPSEQDRRTNFAGSFTALDSNTVIAPPAAITSLSPRDVPGLRLLILGGEKVDVKHISPWRGQATTIIAYANSESTTCMVSCSGESCIDNPGIIGKPLAAVT